MPQYSAMAPRLLVQYRILLPLFALLLSAGCSSTYLDGPAMTESYTKLASYGRRPIRVLLDTPAEEKRLGHQWVFIAAPIGSIRVHDLRQIASVALFQRLAERGYRPTIVTPENESILDPDITVTDFDLSCAVPDLLFVRRVNCSALIRGSSQRAPSVPVTGRGQGSEFRSMGFKPQLEQVLGQALTAALDDFLNDMHF